MRYFLTLVVIAIYGGSATYIGISAGAAKVQAKWDAEKFAIATAQRTKEAELRSNMDKLREAYSHETSKLSRTVASLNDRVRSRPTRPAVPASATVGDGAPGCTGAGLYKPDGEFLIRESSRADQIRLALIQCQDAYRAASGQ